MKVWKNRETERQTKAQRQRQRKKERVTGSAREHLPWGPVILAALFAFCRSKCATRVTGEERRRVREEARERRREGERGKEGGMERQRGGGVAGGRGGEERRRDGEREAGRWGRQRAHLPEQVGAEFLRAGLAIRRPCVPVPARPTNMSQRERESQLGTETIDLHM